MCGACGVLGGGPDWIDRVDTAGVQHRPGLTRQAERHRRVQMVNLLLSVRRCQLSDLSNVILLRGPTGRSEVVDSLTHVWSAVERIGVPAIDPLDDAILEHITAGK